MSSLPEQPEINPFATPGVVARVDPGQSDLDLKQYATVRMGLQFISYSAVALILLTILATILFGMIAMYSSGPNMGGNDAIQMTAFFTMLLFLVGMLGTTVGSLIGVCMCASCPNPNEKGLAITSVMSIFAYLGISVLSVFSGTVFGVAGPGNQSMAVINFVASLLGTVAFTVGTVTFCLLFKRIGANISSERLSKSAHVAMIWFILLNVVSIVGFILLVVVAWFSFANGPGVMVFFAIVAIPLSIVVIAMGFGTLVQFLSMVSNGIQDLKPRTDE